VSLFCKVNVHWQFEARQSEVGVRALTQRSRPCGNDRAGRKN
jgi:hypothetical protein